MLSLPASVRVFLCRQPTDMRRSFDGLSRLAEDIGALPDDPNILKELLTELLGLLHKEKFRYEKLEQHIERHILLVAKKYELRQAKSVKLLADIYEWLREQGNIVLPKSPVGQAIAYAQSNWAALNRYVEDGELSIDNNFAELAMRHVAVGRKNWLFFGSDRGGATWAVITSLLYSAKLHKLNLFEYMRDVLTHIADTPLSELGKFLPDVWKQSHLNTDTPQ